MSRPQILKKNLPSKQKLGQLLYQVAVADARGNFHPAVDEVTQGPSTWVEAACAGVGVTTVKARFLFKINKLSMTHLASRTYH